MSTNFCNHIEENRLSLLFKVACFRSVKNKSLITCSWIIYNLKTSCTIISGEHLCMKNIYCLPSMSKTSSINIKASMLLKHRQSMFISTVVLCTLIDYYLMSNVSGHLSVQFCVVGLPYSISDTEKWIDPSNVRYFVLF